MLARLLNLFRRRPPAGTWLAVAPREWLVYWQGDAAGIIAGARVRSDVDLIESIEWEEQRPGIYRVVVSYRCFGKSDFARLAL